MLRPLACLTILVTVLAPALAQDQCVVLVGLHWPDHDLSHAQVRVHRDKERRDLVGAFPATDASGKVLLTAAPGTYYLSAVVDMNNDGQLNAGDGLGFYGVEDPNTQQPQPLEIKEKASGLWLTISLMMDKDGKLTPTGVRQPAPQTEPARHQLSGAVTGGTEATTIIYLVPASGHGQCFATTAGENGAFELGFTDGTYFVFAIKDTNATEGADPGDLCALHGYTAEQGKAFPTTQLTADVANAQLQLQWRISNTGLLKHVETQADGPQMALQTLPAAILGQVMEPDSAASGMATASGSARFAGDTVTARITGARFVLSVPAGLYYLSVMARSGPASNDLKPALPGDLIGFYGVTDIKKAHGPQPVALMPGEMLPVRIHLIGKLDEQLHPTPLGNETGPAQ